MVAQDTTECDNGLTWPLDSGESVSFQKRTAYDVILRNACTMCKLAVSTRISRYD
ncbi:hypothetical protein HDV63DRAFT_349229 [Trichoderma sp. SZMC 28014]